LINNKSNRSEKSDEENQRKKVKLHFFPEAINITIIFVTAHSPVIIVISQIAKRRAVWWKIVFLVITVLRIHEIAVCLFPRKKANAVSFTGELRAAAVTAMAFETCWKVK
jgi:hypothetical protein